MAPPSPGENRNRSASDSSPISPHRVQEPALPTRTLTAPAPRRGALPTPPSSSWPGAAGGLVHTVRGGFSVILSGGRAHRLEMGVNSAGRAKEILVKIPQTAPHPFQGLRGGGHTSPPPEQSKVNPKQTRLLPPKETRKQCPAEVRGAGV